LTRLPWRKGTINELFQYLLVKIVGNGAAPASHQRCLQHKFQLRCKARLLSAFILPGLHQVLAMAFYFASQVSDPNAFGGNRPQDWRAPHQSITCIIIRLFFADRSAMVAALSEFSHQPPVGMG